MDRRLATLRWLGWETFKVPPDILEASTVADSLAYAKAVMVCAAGDGEISTAERAWMVGYATTQGYPDELIEVVRTYDGSDGLAELVNSSPIMRLTGRALVYDAIRACASDGELSDGERERILDAARKLGVPADVVAELERIVGEEEQLRERRYQVVLASALAGGGPG